MQEQITIKPDGKVFLTLPGKYYKSNRNIGRIFDGVFHTSRTEKHLYNYSNSLGICYKLIKYAPENLFNLICIEFGFKHLWTCRVALLKYGKFVNYSGNGLERQLHLPLDKFKHSEPEARAELRELNSSDALEIETSASQNLKSYTGTVHNLKQEVLFNESV
jgi:hypothetical protein